jgi:hypothetical protein
MHQGKKKCGYGGGFVSFEFPPSKKFNLSKCYAFKWLQSAPIFAKKRGQQKN